MCSAASPLANADQCFDGAYGHENQPPALLVVLAHPDDESFPMGGTLAKYAAQGAQVTLVCATRGEAGIAGADAG